MKQEAEKMYSNHMLRIFYLKTVSLERFLFKLMWDTGGSGTVMCSYLTKRTLPSYSIPS